MAEARETAESAVVDCPVLDGAAYAHYRAAVKAGSEFGEASAEWLRRRSPAAQGAWLATSVSATRPLFQPWNLEILFLLAVSGRARFNELHKVLGLSTRTLSNKLRGLVGQGLVERIVHPDEQPVRIEYALTRHGAGVAALAAPLIARVNLDTLERAGRLPVKRRRG